MREPRDLNSSELNPPEQELADALSRLHPTPARTPMQQVWYRAGLEAGRRRAERWRAMAGAAGVAAVVLLAWGLRPVPAPPERVVYVERAAAPLAVAAVATSDPFPPSELSTGYLQLRDALALHGLEALSRPSPITRSGDFWHAPRVRPLSHADDFPSPSRPYLWNEQG